MDASQLDLVYGPGTGNKVRSAKLLVVGAGGVGCELIKNLALSGFVGVQVIDLDIIDVSNLNRQFLFRRRHVSQPKAHVAAETVEAMVPGAGVQPTVGNIKDKAFDRAFFQRFDAVLNALDNLEARRHVNRMCLAAGTPLVESGSTGYNGQCTVILGLDTECYDCSPKPAQKSFAVCTIRSTPEQPIHCIVWAKFLYGLVFGPEDESNVLADLNKEKTADEEATSTITSSLRPWDGETALNFAKRLAKHVFDTDIGEQIGMKDLWKKRPPPIVQDVPALAQNFGTVRDIDLLEQRQWNAAESSAVLLQVVEKLVTTRKSELGTLSFDKDDDDALAFVVAASNLRAAAYGVELQSPFSVKGIAGNIIHAIATTNAMVASLIAFETLKLVVSKKEEIKDRCKTTFVQKYWSSGRRRLLIQPEALQPPNPDCYVCSRGQLVLSLDPSQMTLKRLLDMVVIGRLGVVEPSINMTFGEMHNVLYETGDGLEPDEIEMYHENAERTLEELALGHGAVLDVEDFSQEFKCTILLERTTDLSKEEYPDGYRLEGAAKGTIADGIRTKKRSREPESTTSAGNGDIDGDLVVVDEEGLDVRSKKAKLVGNEPIQLD